MSGTVTSHANGLLYDQGINIAPSGRLPSDQDGPTGSLHAGTCAFLMALQNMSLIIIIIITINVLMMRNFASRNAQTGCYFGIECALALTYSSVLSLF